MRTPSQRRMVAGISIGARWHSKLLGAPRVKTRDLQPILSPPLPGVLWSQGSAQKAGSVRPDGASPINFRPLRARRWAWRPKDPSDGGGDHGYGESRLRRGPRRQMRSTMTPRHR